MKYYFQTVTIILFIVLQFPLNAQEFDLSVKVSAPNLKAADPKVMEALSAEMENLFNNTQWTEDNFEEHERIKGNVQLTIKEDISPTNFIAELVIQTSRPVFNSTYNTQTMRYLDRNVKFTYDGLRPIQQTKDGYIDNFSSILSFYAYYMLAVDYDTFSKMGGSAYYDKAFSIYNNIPNSIQRSDAGWAQDDKRQQNRYFLIESALSPRFRKYREAQYTYHRLGLDKMFDDVEGSRQILLEAITDVGRVNKETNNTILPKMFSDTKRLEILDIFLVADAVQKTKVRNIMISIDATQSEAYRDLR